jgi:Protein of unknown function (DUF2958)
MSVGALGYRAPLSDSVINLTIITMTYNARSRVFSDIVPMTKEEKEQNESQYGSIAVEVRYNKGGMNYFAGQMQPRCYSLSVYPCDDVNGIKSFLLMGKGFDGGTNILIYKTERFSAKALKELADAVDAEQIARLYAADDRQGLQAVVEKLRGGRTVAPAQKPTEPPAVSGMRGGKLLTKEILERLPKLGETSEVKNPLVQAKLFYPDFSWNWYLIEYDGEDLFYGLVDGFEAELGTFRLSELLTNRGKMGLPIERDSAFRPLGVDEVMATLQGKKAIAA